MASWKMCPFEDSIAKIVDFPFVMLDLRGVYIYTVYIYIYLADSLLQNGGNF